MDASGGERHTTTPCDPHTKGRATSSLPLFTSQALHEHLHMNMRRTTLTYYIAEGKGIMNTRYRHPKYLVFIQKKTGILPAEYSSSIPVV